WTSGAERVSGRKSGRAASKLPAAVPIVIEQLSPVVDAGRYAPKRVSGDTCVVGAAIFRDGHDILAARVRYLPAGTREWQTVPMLYDYASDRWSAEFPLNAVGHWAVTVAAWTDVTATWSRATRPKRDQRHDLHPAHLQA